MSIIKVAWRQRHGTWYARFAHPITGKRIERSTGCCVKRLAEKWLEDEWRRLLRPEEAPLPEIALADAAGAYLADREQAVAAKRPGAESPTTLRGRKKKLRLVVRLLGPELPLSKLTIECIEAFCATRLEHISAHSLYKDLTELRLLCRWAVEQGYLRENPADEVTVEFSVEKVDRSITPEEFRKLHDALADKRKLYAALIVETGARPGREAEGITWGDVDLARKLVRIRGEKTAGADRHVPIRETFAARLSAERDGADDQTPVVERWGNAPRDFKAACKRAGIRHVRPYDLRHTFASWALQGGAPDTHVAKALGHANTAMVHRTYGHLRPEHLRSVIDALPEIPGADETETEATDAPQGPAEAGPTALEEATSAAVSAVCVEISAPDTPQNEADSGENAPTGSQNEETRNALQHPGFLEFSGGDDRIRTGEWRFCSRCVGPEPRCLTTVFADMPESRPICAPDSDVGALNVEVSLLLDAIRFAEGIAQGVVPQTASERRLHAALRQVVAAAALLR